MSREVTIDVMMAGYLNREPALLDYQSVLDSGAKYEGVVCVTRDLEGNTSIEETDHMKRGGAKVLGTAGFVVGLFAPPLLLSAVLGAAVGAGLGHLAHGAVKSSSNRRPRKRSRGGAPVSSSPIRASRRKRSIRRSPAR